MRAAGGGRARASAACKRTGEIGPGLTVVEVSRVNGKLLPLAVYLGVKVQAASVTPDTGQLELKRYVRECLELFLQVSSRAKVHCHHEDSHGP